MQGQGTEGRPNGLDPAMTIAEGESISRVRDLLNAEAIACPDLADLWAGWSEDLQALASGEPVMVDDD